MKHAAKRRGVSTRAFVALLAVVLVIGCVAGGTVAWLTATTGPVTNTFTYGNIDITLAETTKGPYKIVPGAEIAKDPKVTVKANSEKCWLFVEVTEENWLPTLTYTIDGANGWTAVPGVNKVYYQVVDNATTDQLFAVLKDNTVHVSDTLNKTTVDAANKAGTMPKLTFTAYAVQYDAATTAEAAWELAK